MKLKLLLCYALVAGTICFAAVESDEEEDETLEIVSDPLAAMGRAPSAQAQKMSNKRVVTVVGDPYAQMKQPEATQASVGDPYAVSQTKENLVQGDPYASIGASPVTYAAKKQVKKLEKKAIVAPKTKKMLILTGKKEPVGTAFSPIGPVKEAGSLSAVLFKSTGSNDPEAQAAMLEIERQVKNQENQLHQVARQNLASVTQVISDQAVQLREDADAAARMLKIKTENQVQALITTAEEQIDSINKKISEKALELKQNAAKQALVVLDDIEARSAEKRMQERKRVLAATFGINEDEISAKKKVKKITKGVHENAVKIAKKDEQQSTPVKKVITSTAGKEKTAKPAQVDNSAVSNVMRVSAEWKNDLSRRFYQDMTTMKSIIVDAESASEAQDFLKKFEAQNKWFDLTLRSTNVITDVQYEQLVAKQAQMRRLMQAQNAADDYLQKFTKNMAVDHMQLKKVRLNVLYDLTASLQQRASHLDRSVRESGLPDEDVKILVKRTLSEVSQQFRDIAAQFPDVEISGFLKKPQLSLAAVPVAAMKLEEELKKTKELADAKQKELESAQQELATVQELVTKTQAELDHERLEKEKLIKDVGRIKTTALQVLDSQERDKLAAQLALTGVQQDQGVLKNQLVSAGAKNMKLQRTIQQLVGSVEGSRKETMLADLLRSESAANAQKSVKAMNLQQKEQIKVIRESGSHRELDLVANLQKAHERINVLTVKQAKLMQDLEQQHKKTTELKNSFKNAQETANKAESLADLAKRALAESRRIVQQQVALREHA